MVTATQSATGAPPVVEPKQRILAAAVKLLAAEGRESVTTRAVSALATVQPPTIYRHFGDMRTLLEAAASAGLDDYLSRKRRMPRSGDPFDDLRTGWDTHVEFGLTNPHVYTVLYGDPPRRTVLPQGVVEANAILHGLMHRAASTGRLRFTVERAAEMVHSACRGVTLTLISTPAAQRDAGLSHATREALLAAIAEDGAEAAGASERGPGSLTAQAVALKARLRHDGAPLTAAEQTLLHEWLDRLVAADR